jgi:hypothetical protein
MQKKEQIGYLMLFLVVCISGYLIYSQTKDLSEQKTVSGTNAVASKNKTATDEMNSAATPQASDTQKIYQTVKLYYYQGEKDNDQCSEKGLFPVERQIVESRDIKDTIRDTIVLLMEGRLKKEEGSNESGFPLYNVNLDKVVLDREGVLSLTFSDPDYQTTGGSCATGIMVGEIEATAKQFPEVKEVNVLPEGVVFGA